jgi:hypothetical protein
MTDPVLTAHCNCGAVRLEVDAPLLGAGYCHCIRCQRRTGAGAAATARVVPGSVRIVAGEDQIRHWRPQDGFAKAFCVECGSALFSQNPDAPDELNLRLGIIDGDPGVAPAFRQFTANAAVWEPIPDDDLPRHPQRRTR